MLSYTLEETVLQYSIYSMKKHAKNTKSESSKIMGLWYAGYWKLLRGRPNFTSDGMYHKM